MALKVADIRESNKLSEMMKHYFTIKDKYPDCVILYRLGDFYELFFDDAIEVSKVLDITLTGRSCGFEERAPMCGIPYHAVETYLTKLIANGYKVAICEQLSEPKKGEQVLRDVVRVITPGTIIDENIIDNTTNNFLACIYENNGNIGASYVDISTGELVVAELDGDNSILELNDLLIRIQPAEILSFMEQNLEKQLDVCKANAIVPFKTYKPEYFNKQFADNVLSKHFGENFKDEYKLKNKNNAIISCGALFQYLNETQKRTLVHINKIELQKNNNYMSIDINTRKNLEILETMRDKRKKGALISVLDKTQTCMGKRLMRKWVEQPLNNLKEINARLDSVEEISRNLIKRDNLKSILREINDIERISARISYGNFTPKDAEGLKNSLIKIPEVKKLLENCKSNKLLNFYQTIPNFEEIEVLLNNAIAQDPPRLLSNGGYIKSGYNKELDEYRNIQEVAVNWQKQLEEKEREETGIKNLKISYNKVFGYFIEVNKQYSDLVPMRYKRKQTIANNERYITEELKELEEKILLSSDNAIKLEQKIFAQIVQTLIDFIPKFQYVSHIIAELDCINSFAEIAITNNYVKPKISDKINSIKIEEGRHPVVEDLLKKNTFIPNDTILDDNENKIMIITGPNMAGKSTFMRQVAIITLMAHIGSFVPCKSAEICLTDKIFTRVGASDDLAIGQSTFMVEMMEVANILHNATDKSLVILDEIGRGTSTYDGLSIAWAVVEYLSKVMKCKTLFATHYHELTELEGFLEGVKNYKITVKEINDTLVFLRKIARGGANRSFGVEVAKLAGIPNEIIQRAKQISNKLEASNVNSKIVKSVADEKENFEQKEKSYQDIIAILKDLDINKMTPLGAFDTMCDLITRVKN